MFKTIPMSFWWKILGLSGCCAGYLLFFYINRLKGVNEIMGAVTNGKVLNFGGVEV